MDGGQIARRMRMGHAGVIFVEDDTAAIMEAGFDLPIAAFDGILGVWPLPWFWRARKGRTAACTRS